MRKGQVLYYIYEDCFSIGVDAILITDVRESYFLGVDSDGIIYRFRLEDVGEIIFFSPEEGVKKFTAQRRRVQAC